MIGADERLGLVRLILGDLERKDSGRLKNVKGMSYSPFVICILYSRYSIDRPLACEALKTLGRSPDSALLLSKKENLELLIKNADISPDIVRTLANALLLQSEGRLNFPQAGGGEYTLKLIASTNDPTTLFLGSRLMFLMTLDPGSVPVMKELIEKGVVEITVGKIDVLVKQLQLGNGTGGGGGDPMAKEGLSDMMKYVYNMMLHFSRAEVGKEGLVMGEAWSDKFTP